MGAIFSLGGHASNTDRQHQLEGWGDLKNVMYNTFAEGNPQVKEGQGNLTSAADYFKALMSGDQAKMSQVLAPQISVIKGQNQQRINTLSQFGNRSGGTNAATQSLQEDATRSIQQLFDMLGPEAAKEVGAIGSAQEGAGTNLLNLSRGAASDLSANAGGTRSEDRASEAALAQSGAQAVAALLGIL